MSLTRQDPLKYFVGFGSISGRFGGNGLTDYAAGNDVMSKAVDWFRAQRPECATGTIHWESWEGSGMATLPRFAFGPKSVMNMKYMTPEEGVERLDQELQAGLPESEVLFTFGEFYPMFYPDEQRPLGEFVPGPLNARPSKPRRSGVALAESNSARREGLPGRHAARSGTGSVPGSTPIAWQGLVPGRRGIGITGRSCGNRQRQADRRVPQRSDAGWLAIPLRSTGHCACPRHAQCQRPGRLRIDVRFPQSRRRSDSEGSPLSARDRGDC